MSTPKPPEPDVSRWSCLTWLLSLDVVVPFHGLMGLDRATAPQLRDVLRREIVAVRKDARARPKDAPPFGPGRTAGAVEAVLGAGYRSRLETWAARVFHYSNDDNLALWYWDGLLRHCRRSPALWAAVGFPPAIRDEAQGRFVASLDMSECDALHEETYNQSLSDWDLHLYAVFFLNDDPTYGITDGPDDFVRPTIRDRQAYNFWGWVLRTLTPPQLDQLWESAGLVVRQEQLTSIPGLPRPKSLEPIP